MNATSRPTRPNVRCAGGARWTRWPDGLNVKPVTDQTPATEHHVGPCGYASRRTEYHIAGEVAVDAHDPCPQCNGRLERIRQDGTR